jgi:hypothetical protein
MKVAHRGVCPDMACQRVAIEIERQASERRACQVVADELGIPVKTVLTWIHRNKVTSNEVSKNQANYPEKETSSIVNLHTMQFDSGRKKLVYGVRETDGNRLFTIQEYRLTGKGKEVATMNRLTLPLDLFCQFLVHSVMIKQELSGELVAVDSDHKEEDPLAGDDAGAAQEKGNDDLGIKTKPSSAPAAGAENTTIEAELVHCIECAHFAIKKWALEENGPCNLVERSWNGRLFQPPYEPHPCPNFSSRDQQGG